jgi:hypothetical protein
MSEEWRPDDSILEGDSGRKRIRDALEDFRIEIDERVVTSRDPGMDEVRNRLKNSRVPQGFDQWQLPIFLNDCPTFFYLTVAQPGAVIPRHSHTRDLFRVVISGSITVNGIELKSADWMFVPKGVSYSYSAALNPGAITMHSYG